MLGEDRRHPLAILQALARHRYQKLHRHLRRDLALAHLLLDGFRQNLRQRQPPRNQLTLRSNRRANSSSP
jgi:hypothetical protein